MDLALALHRINPDAEYRLNDDKTAIADWRGPGQQPTQAQLQAAWDAVVAEQGAATTTRQADVAEVQALLDKVTGGTSLTQAELRAALRHLLKSLRAQAD